MSIQSSSSEAGGRVKTEATRPIQFFQFQGGEPLILAAIQEPSASWTNPTTLRTELYFSESIFLRPIQLNEAIGGCKRLLSSLRSASWTQNPPERRWDREMASTTTTTSTAASDTHCVLNTKDWAPWIRALGSRSHSMGSLSHSATE